MRKRKILINEFRRKIFHILILAYPALYYIILRLTKSKFLGLSILLGILLTFIIKEYFRIFKNLNLPLIKKLYREFESDKIGGEIYYMIGCILALYFFDLRIAAAGILMVNFGDAISTIIGISFGKTKIVENKTLEGFIAGLFMNLIITILILENLLIAIPMAITGSITELFSKKINDNLSIPLVSGLIGRIIKMFLL